MRNIGSRAVECAGIALLSVLGVASAAHDASASTVLFATQDDFTGWSSDLTTGPQASPDLDGSTNNGLASNGGIGTAGSLSISDPTDLTDYGYVFSQGLQGNGGLISMLSTSGDLIVDHTKPSDGSYLQLGAVFNYDGHFDQYFGSEVDNLDGTFTTTIPYTFVPGDVTSYFQLGLILNSDADGAFAVDNIRTSNMIPEPTTLLLSLLSSVGLLANRRRS